ncbi:MAG: stage IV sporulation protein A [Clostridia bacterium]|nr:stage IV sporulation protein A [Clostridia bacterium]
MTNNTIYQDIQQRTGGDIYIGVVGPVRTGKSTFIKRFMDKLVIPNIENEYKRERATDELPQSAQGKTIMTTEPKFVPNEAIKITMDNNAELNVRLIDCVGYVVPEAMGYIEGDSPRMVHTPWFENEIPFENAAEIGTKKVITDHSTIGLVITTDGSITEIDRQSYVDAEQRVINELKEINKPFIVLLNSAYPNSEAVINLKNEMEEKYGTTVIPINCAEFSDSDINDVMKNILFEFPVSEINLKMPKWIGSLDDDHWLKKSLTESVKSSVNNISKIKDYKNIIETINLCEYVDNTVPEKIDLGTGEINIDIIIKDNLFYKLLSETSGLEIENDSELMSLMIELAGMKKEYERFAPALEQVRNAGYGIISPSIDELTLEDPEIVRQGSRYGVRLKASAPSIHLIRADIETEVSPVVGTEKQSEDLVKYLLNEFDDDPIKIWQSNIFGKSLNELVNEGLHTKLDKMPEDARQKLQETLTKIINEGSGGLICIIL